MDTSERNSTRYLSSSDRNGGDDDRASGDNRRPGGLLRRKPPRPSFLSDTPADNNSSPTMSSDYHKKHDKNNNNRRKPQSSRRMDEFLTQRLATLKKSSNRSPEDGEDVEVRKNHRDFRSNHPTPRRNSQSQQNQHTNRKNNKSSPFMDVMKNQRKGKANSKFDTRGELSPEESKSKNLSDFVQQWRRKDTPPKPSPSSATTDDVSSTERQQRHQPWRQLRQQQRQDDAPSSSRSNVRQPLGLGRFGISRPQNPRSPPRQQSPKENKDFLMGRIDHQQSSSNTPPTLQNQAEIEREVTLPPSDIGLTALSSLFRVKVDSIKEQLEALGVDVNDDMTIDIDTMELLAMEFGINSTRASQNDVLDDETILLQRRAGVEEQSTEAALEQNDEVATVSSMLDLPPRPPVVCIMGHVDHGKTTLMDSLRRKAAEQKAGGGGKGKKKKKGKSKNKGKNSVDSSDVAGTEAGGITQIISAFQVDVPGHDGTVTFLDTPGHAAFKSMRQSGSHAADVIVLVVAADDGVSPQTVEIIEFYKSIVDGAGGNGISMVVALNKIDKPGIDVDEARIRIENQLLEHGILTEGMQYTGSDYGPPVQVIPTSGLTGKGLDDLMEGLLLQSEVMDLRADADANAEGIVMDARIEKGLGVVADCIIRWGSISKGDVVVSGTQHGRVRMLKDVDNGMLKNGLPSQPVRIVGFKSLPKAGDPIICLDSEEAAEELVRTRLLAEEQSGGSDRADVANDIEVQIPGMRSQNSRRAQRVFEKAGLEEDSDTIRIPVVIKADADGSLSAVRESLLAMGDNAKAFDIKIDPVAEGIGAVTATDIQMANESNAVIFAFGLKRIDQTTLNMAESQDVPIHSNDIIYSLLDEAKDVFSQYLPKVPYEHIHGSASVQAIFEIDGADGPEKVAGMKVLDGYIYKEKAPLDSGNTLSCNFRVIRDGQQVSPAGETVEASSLRHFKELVDSVRRGEECGLALRGYTDFREGDVIECYSIEMQSPSLS